MNLSYQEQRQLHIDITNVGLRAQGTAIGLIQLCIELRRCNVLDESALDNIKDAISDELYMGGGRRVAARQRRSDIRMRLDRLFAGLQPLGPAESLAPHCPADGDHATHKLSKERP
ncbi:hypothetical protein [Sphingomonas sp. TDK1]|uniref:hypothetical protein n=1 Tax=Sphingomonas sp. TDK1 TaxID=453247 RepID=UPI0007D9B8FC|nr:hypothetical protein [Sphingomonas sp. TDK1]OAN66662.1 hypothetical protein A7X12_11155 [Sphingomonas sp. TDK1]